jgi:beta-N-acetylhexosaminidase
MQLGFSHNQKHRSEIRSFLTKLFSFVLVLAVLAGQVHTAFAAPTAQGSTPLEKAQQLLDQLTPEERVGQLFLVTFTGATAPAESQIYDLIANYHIGAVMLRRDQDNFVTEPSTLDGLSTLISSLQNAEAASSETERADVLSGEVYGPSYIPLFVALTQEGDGYPTDQILEGLSPLPSAMTLGATWNPALARSAGQLLGQELTALGINMLIGPSLDVLETPRPQSLGDLGTRSFGGDPFWVGQMGQAFIEGVHIGSEDSVAVVAKHLPGHGGSDRPVDEEIPTVRKSLDQLTQIELPPFFAVTGDALTSEARSDAMLIAHIRYQGFQGNIRATTRPISLDPQAFSQLMGLPQFATWREAGGVIVSDNLGSRAIRRNYDPSEITFNAPLVARDAFLAGNDLLYLGNFIANNDIDTYTTIRRTVEFFAQKYREDTAFAERVDQSVTRILALKFKLYPQFDIDQVLPNSEAIADLGGNTALAFEVGRQAANLLSPSVEEMPNVLPNPPGAFEQIVFFTDSYSVEQCSQCTPTSSPSVTALADAVLDLYGPNAGNQITAANLISFSFTQLARTLDEQWPDGEDPVSANLQRAEWVVFGLLKEDSRPESIALRRLLSERPDLLQNRRVVVFALNAPYYLDATDITKISAYYGLYSKGEEMAEVAARLLFQEVSAPGSSPVTIDGLGYNLIQATAPDETRVIPLTIERILPVLPEETATPLSTQPDEATPPPTYQAGDVLSMHAGPILDHNGHLVPDNTPVSFSITLFTEGNTFTRQITASTRQGIAMGTYSIEGEGDLQIVASSGEPAALSASAEIDVVGINLEGLALQATQTAQARALATAAAVVISEATEAPEQVPTFPRTGLVDWFLIAMVSGVAGLFAYQVGINLGRVRWAVRWALTSVIGGLVVGCYVALDLPGAQAILSFGGEWGIVLAVLGGAGLGWAAGWLWRDLNRKRRTTTSA